MSNVDAATLAAAYNGHKDQYNQCIVHQGAHYQANNKCILTVLKACTLNGPAWCFVQQFNQTSNRRAAILALKLQNKGGSILTNRKEEAYNLLHNTLYKGKRRNFGFVEYTGIHTGAHTELKECNKPLPETHKVKLFAGIQDPNYKTEKI